MFLNRLTAVETSGWSSAGWVNLCLTRSVGSRAAASTFIAAFLLISVHNTLIGASDNATVQATAAAMPTEQEIREQVKLLGSAKFRARERAENTLSAMGSTAIEILQENESHEDLEIRVRVKRLVGDLRSRFIQAAVPKELAVRFNRYEDESYAVRREALETLQGYSGDGRLRLLACLARFEESELLAKYAALMLMDSRLDEYPAGWKAAQSEIRAGIELSRRVSTEWLRLYLRSHDLGKENAETQSEVVDACRVRILEERSSLQRFDKGTDKDVVRKLSMFLIQLMLRSDMREEALAEIRTLVAETSPTAVDAMSILDWLEEIDVPEAVDELHEKNLALFQNDAVLQYRIAGIHIDRGDDEMGKRLADDAFELAGSGVSSHIVRYPSLKNEQILTERLLRASGQMAARRYALAMVLEDEFGRIDWSEREYLAVMDMPVKVADKDPRNQWSNVYIHFRASHRFSEMLHDQLREKEAGERLQISIKTCEETKQSAQIFKAQLPGVRARMNYFFACDEELKKNFEKQREYLSKGIEADPDDADVLIAMFRLDGASEEWRTETENRITETTERFAEDLRMARAQAKANFDDSDSQEDVARLENQYAWLVGNTIGDIDEAIRASEHSVQIFQGDGGYLDTLGRCYFRKGDLESALKYQRQAVKASPHEMQIQRQLALFEAESESETPERSADATSE